MSLDYLAGLARNIKNLADRLRLLEGRVNRALVGSSVRSDGSGTGLLDVHSHAGTSEGGLVSHDVLSGVSANDHHNQVHDLFSTDHGDVDTDVAPLDGDTLVWDSYSGTWIPDSPGADPDAIHDNVSGEIAAVAEKVTPADADLIIIEDSDDSNSKKKVQIGNLPGGSSLTVKEEDGAPSVASVSEIKVTNGTLTDNTGGSVSIAIGGGAHDLLSATHSDTLADSVLDGDMLIGNVTPKWARLAAGNKAQFLQMGADRPAWVDDVGLCVFQCDGNDIELSTGVKAEVVAPFDGTWTSHEIEALKESGGSIVLDIWKDTYANYPPTVADTITAAAKPTLSTAQKAQDVTLTGWTVDFSAGDRFVFNIDSVTDITFITLVLHYVRR